MTTTTHFSSEQRELLRQQIQGIGPLLPPAPPQNVAPVAANPASSSIAPSQSTNTATPQIRPELPTPDQHFMYGLIQTHKELEAITSKQSRLFAFQIKRDMEEIDRLEHAKTQKIQQNASVIQSQNTWGALSTATQFVMAGTSVVVGLACITSGVALPAGVMLIASGILGLTGRILHDTDTLTTIAEWFTKSVELQQKIARQIEMGFFFLSLGFGLSGGMWAHSLGAFSTTAKIINIQKIAAGIGIGSSIGKNAADLRNSFLKKTSAHLEASIQRKTRKIEELFQNIRQSYQETHQFIEIAGDIGDKLKSVISASGSHQD